MVLVLLSKWRWTMTICSGVSLSTSQFSGFSLHCFMSLRCAKVGLFPCFNYYPSCCAVVPWQLPIGNWKARSFRLHQSCLWKALRSIRWTSPNRRRLGNCSAIQRRLRSLFRHSPCIFCCLRWNTFASWCSKHRGAWYHTCRGLCFYQQAFPCEGIRRILFFRGEGSVRRLAW